MKVKENSEAVEGLLRALDILRTVQPELSSVPAGMGNGMSGVNSAIKVMEEQVAHIIMRDMITGEIVCH